MWSRRIVVLIAGCLIAASCAGTEPAPEVPAGDTTTTDSVAPVSTTTGSSSTSAPDTTTTTTTSTTTTMPGMAVDGPPSGTVWSVVGVAHDDTLNVRSQPGVDSPIVGVLEPTEDEVAADGDARLVGSTIWWSVAVDALEGWASSSYLAMPGSTSDVTSAVTEANEGERPSADSLDDLAAEVARLRGADEMVVVVAASAGTTTGEVVIDLFMFGDDSVRGERILVAGQRSEGDTVWGLYTAEATTLCWRGVDAGGLCV